MIEDLTNTVGYFNEQLKIYFANRRYEASDVSTLFDSIEYSLFNGGKRFRPKLCYSLAQALGLSKEWVTPWAMAIEFIHTYSLIHDDLPCMDDDAERRGQPTNHILFGEGMALLAGDSLLTESFNIVAQAYPQHCSQLIKLLSQGSGAGGMIRGQVLDIGKGTKINSLGDLIHLHELKTGQLISLCFEGLSVLAQKNSHEFKELGLQLGLAFQVKDDLLDQNDGDTASFISFLGVEGTQNYLESLTEKINQKLLELSLYHPTLRQLVEFNQSRQS